MPPAAALVRLRAKPPAERRIALVLSGPSVTRQIATGLLAALRDSGYRVENAPDDATALASRLRGDSEESLSFATYSAVFATLPMPVQQGVSAKWGAAERDPLFRPGRLDCGRFVIPALRCGNIALLVPPIDGEPGPVPPHSYLAAVAWLSDEFRADAVIDLGGRGERSMESMVLGPVPYFAAPVGEGERVLAAIEHGEP